MGLNIDETDKVFFKFFTLINNNKWTFPGDFYRIPSHNGDSRFSPVYVWTNARQCNAIIITYVFICELTQWLILVSLTCSGVNSRND